MNSAFMCMRESQARHDDDGAEAGSGMEMGAGCALRLIQHWILRLTVTGWGLLAHEENECREGAVRLMGSAMRPSTGSCCALLFPGRCISGIHPHGGSTLDAPETEVH